ncbi:MAG: hypothetical protein LBN10_10360, partial [Propionibacteriaceae bacterium]|nr:hypothetical protein [Propionibacteriaceae bacterium]
MSRPIRHTVRLATAVLLAAGTALFGLGAAPAAVADPPVSVSSAGTEFWLTFDVNDQGSGNQYLKLYVTGAPGTTGQAVIDGLSFTEAFTIPADGVAVVDIPLAARLTLSPNPAPVAIHVTTDADVSVYGLNRAQYTTDAYLGLPVTALGTRYRAIGYGSNTYRSFISVVPTAGVTTVHIEPLASTGVAPFDKVIQLGEVYEWNASFDVTGTLVTSDKPVSVFAGNQCANIPIGVTFCDHIVEQMTSTSSWGKTFVTFPLATRSSDTFRVLADVDGTVVTINKGGVEENQTLAAGKFYEFVSGVPTTITATQPVLVAQYSNGGSWDHTVADPFMTLIPPYEQGFTASTFATPTEGFTGHYVNITAPTTSLAGVTLDGVPVPVADWEPIPGSDYSGVAIPIAPGFHHVEAGVAVQVIVYGFGTDDSYGYPSGMRTAQIALATTLTLNPTSVTGSAGTQLCTTATLADQGGIGIAGANIDVTLSGVVTQSTTLVTGADGTVAICATSAADGTTDITATQGSLQATGTFTWQAASHVYGTLQTTRTITYTGAGDLTPTEVVQTVVWTTDTNLGTGVTTYTTTDSYPAVASPAIAGYAVDQAIVAAVSLTTTT